MIKIFEIEISQKNEKETKKTFEQFLGSNLQYQIATVNPEMLMSAIKNPSFLKILKEKTINFADGFGLQLVTLGKIKHRQTGNDLLKILFSLAQEKKKKIFFLGGKKGESEKAVKILKKDFPKLNISYDYGGEIKKENNSWLINSLILKKIKKEQPDILAVALGHQKQELFIHDFLPILPSVKIAIGVGGAFAFLSGEIKRAPRLWQKIGLEWLWRLFQEPQRIKRIITAVIIFPVYYFFDKIKQIFKIKKYEIQN